jgi:5-hydroxyisourate hydrolase
MSPVPSPFDRPPPSKRQAPDAEPLVLTRRSLAALGLGGVAAAASGRVAHAQAQAVPGKPGTLTAGPVSQAGLGPRLTLHAIDNFHGTPGAGMVCDLSVRDGDTYRPIKTVTTAANGRPPEPLLVDDALKAGQYELLMHVEAYFAALGVTLPSPNFLSRVPIRFRIRDAGQRYHLPVLFTPWGYSYYRGS